MSPREGGALGIVGRIGVAFARRPVVTVLLWIVLFIGAVGLSLAVPGSPSDTYEVPGANSTRAHEILRSDFPGAGPTTASVVFHDPNGREIAGEGARTTIGAALNEIRQQPKVTAVADPYVVGAVSPDGTTAIGVVTYGATVGELGRSAVGRLRDAVEPAQRAGFQVELGGPLVSDTANRGSIAPEVIGGLGAALILLYAFGTLRAAAICLMAAAATLGVGLALLSVVSRWIDIPSVAPAVASMIGLGVSIDYALFIVMRVRQTVAPEADPVAVVGAAMDAAGRSVVIAGATVILSIAGLLLAGVPAISGLALALALVVSIAVAVELTLTPALIAHWHSRLSPADNWLGRRRNRPDHASLALVRRVVRHPVRAVVASVALLLLLASPVLAMRLGQLDAGLDPPHQTQRRAFDLVAKHFVPGANGPLLVIARGENRGPVGRRLSTLPGVALAAPVGVVEDEALFVVTPFAPPRDQATLQLVHRIRELGDGDSVLVGGSTAAFADIATRIGSRLPVVIVGVLAIALVALTLFFRAPVVALKMVLMNLLSIGASFGVLVVVFQYGWGGGFIGAPGGWPIVSFIPLLAFSFAFGLSIDYEIFILSSVKERYLESGNNDLAVVEGTAAAARVITPAALIMIAVFTGFVLDPDPNIKMMGLALASAIAVDATVVRMVLVPSTMTLLGRMNWWSPWADRRRGDVAASAIAKAEG